MRADAQSRRTSPLALADIPLGPWAGYALQLFTSTAGARWHADYGCTVVTNRSRSKTIRQPVTGTMADVTLPDKFHCVPADEAGRYLQAARLLVREDEINSATLQSAVENQRLNLDVLRSGTSRLDEPVTTELQSYRDEVRRRRQECMVKVIAELPTRLPMMLCAQWVASGRTAHEYQPQFAAFTDIVHNELDRLNVVGDRASEYVCRWLADVAAGMSTQAASQRFVARESNGLHLIPDLERGPATVTQGLESVTQRWTDLMQGIALATKGDVIVLHNGCLPVDYDTQVAVGHLGGGASVDLGFAMWAVQRLPAIMARLIGDQRPRGFEQVLAPADRLLSDEDICPLLLHNLIVTTGLENVAGPVTCTTAYDKQSRMQMRDLPMPDGVGEHLRHRGPDEAAAQQAVTATRHRQRLASPPVAPAARSD